MRDKPHILIVDDTPQNIQILGGMLRKQDYEVIVAKNGIQALKVVEQVLPDLILLDVMMPEMDGYQTCQQLKESPLTKDIPVIFLTALTESEDMVKGFKLGAVDYVPKPFHVTELLARVKTHLDLKFSKETILQKNSAQKELLHILCHDLANPIATVQGYLKWAQNKPAEWLYEKKEKLLVSTEIGLETIDLVRKILTLEEKKLSIELESIGLTEAVKKSLSILSPWFEKKTIEPILEMEDNLQVRVEETSFINSVLNNIFTNAIKFSFDHSQIHIKAYQDDIHVHLIVTDYGLGMPENLLTDLFDINKKTSRRGTNGEEGTGYGMPLMKKFVTAYGGELKITSQENAKASGEPATIVKLILMVG